MRSFSLGILIVLLSVFSYGQIVRPPTPNNLPYSVVQRDANGNFTAGTITVTVIGTATNVADADYGEITVSSGVWTVDDDVIGTEHFKDQDWGDVSASSGVVSINTDAVNDTHIDWGTGASQVSAVDVPIADAGSYLTGTEVETALQEIAREAEVHILNGFETRSSSTLASDAGTPPTITLEETPNLTDVYYWQSGSSATFNTAKTIQISDVNGIHLIYFDGASLAEEVNPSHATVDNLIENYALVMWVYWNTNNNTASILADERHGVTMSGATHHWLHDNIGATYKEGFALSGYVINSAADADVAFEVSDGEFYDEDLDFDIEDGSAANQYEQQLSGGDAEIPVLYKDDINGTWTEQAADTLPYILQGGDTYVSYNNDDGDGTWSLIELGNQKFMIMWLFATNDWQYPIKMVCGSETYNTLALALAGTSTEVVNWGTLPSAEIVLLYQMVIQAASGGTKSLKIIEVNDYRTTRVTGASYSPTDHGTLSGLLDDDHTQYLLKTTFDAQSIVSATVDNTPIVLAVAEQELVGRITGGNVDGITIGIADNNILQVDHASPADDDYARFTTTGIEGRDATEVKTDLGLVIGTNVLAYDAGIQNLAGVAMAADKFYYTSGDNTHVAGDVTVFARTILDDADAATVQATLGLVIGTNVLAEQTIGILDDNLLEVDDADDLAVNDYTKVTASGLVGRTYAQVLADLSGTATGAFAWNSQNLTGIGTIGSGAITSTADVMVNTTNYVLEGDATGRLVLRTEMFRIRDGTVPGTDLEIASIGTYFNGPTWTGADELEKGATEGSCTATADGISLTIDFAETVVDVINVGNVETAKWATQSTTAMYFPTASVTAGNLQLDIRKRGVARVDWYTVIADAADQVNFSVSMLCEE